MKSLSFSFDLHLEERIIIAFYFVLATAGLVVGGWNFTPFAQTVLFHGVVLVLIASMMLAPSPGSVGLASALRHIRNCAPFILGPMGYEALKRYGADELITALGIPPRDELMLAADRALFGQALPFHLEGLVSPWFSGVMWFFYIFIYASVLFALPAFLYFFRVDDRMFYRLRRGLVITFAGGYLCYLLVPVAGPLATMGDHFGTSIGGGFGLSSFLVDSQRFKWDCFPSLHTAIPWVAALSLFRPSPNWFKVVALVCAVMITFSTVYLRFHYGVDLICGVLWAVAVVLLTGRFSDELLPRPTPGSS